MSMTPTEVPASAPAREQVQLGNQVLELAPDDAATVRRAFQDLAQSYGASLDDQRRQLLSTMGTPQWQPPPVSSPSELVLDVPDPDLLFSNKDAWAASFAQNLEGRIRRAQGEQAALLQGAVSAVDQELQRRDLQTLAQTTHDQAMEEMLERRGLGDHRRIVQTIYNEQYGNLQHLPLGVALDQLGALAEQEIASIRGTQPAAAATPQQTAPPAMLRSARRASSAPTPEQAPRGKTLSDLIRAHHTAFLDGGRAA